MRLRRVKGKPCLEKGSAEFQQSLLLVEGFDDFGGIAGDDASAVGEAFGYHAAGADNGVVS